MSQFTRVRWRFLLLVLFCHTAIAATPIHHQLDVTLEPESGHIEAEDVITLPEAVTTLMFDLHAGLELQLLTPEARIIKKTNRRSSVPIKRYKIKLPTTQNSLRVAYSGKIQHKLEDHSQDYSGGRSTSLGIISDQGVFLSISSYWFPVIADSQVSFSLHTTLPEGWHSISQGSGSTATGWSETAPQDDIYLIAGKYHIFTHPTDVAETQVYLRQPDQAVAERYLQATESYLKLFSKLLGPYPYSKFALVENFWESGYGMPSFTLLGPKVIRLPFILHSSYPHEILHNWWGNGVFIDYTKGNWSEGLTTYLADHMIREQQGQGSAYRRDALQNYVDYVTKKKDFSLHKFRGHQGQASQAIGYGKALMFFHMLRIQLGDETFLNGIRQFYLGNLYQNASYSDLQQALEKTSGQDLSTEFKQWTRRKGAPALEIAEHDLKATDDGFEFRYLLRQTQKGAPYKLQVPVYIQSEDGAELIQQTITMTKREMVVKVPMKQRPVAINVDPLFDIFRRLNPGEIPSSLGQLFSSHRSMVILPSNAEPEIRTAYKEMANGWRKREKRMKVVWDNNIRVVPKNRMLWVLGRENLLLDEFRKAATGLPMAFNDDSVEIGGKQISLDQHSVVLTSRRPKTIGWLHGHSAAAISGLARKIPHYGKYSYLAFSGDNPDNILKGQWPTENSDLQYRLQKNSKILNPPEHQPLSGPIM
ncbi:MAG: M1 family metallopeptidase [Gammaproteobacteria bacterium]|nr:M1 family metallopeptidase [Gammaproteobacteria bacterium]